MTALCVFGTFLSFSMVFVSLHVVLAVLTDTFSFCLVHLPHPRFLAGHSWLLLVLVGPAHQRLSLAVDLGGLSSSQLLPIADPIAIPARPVAPVAVAPHLLCFLCAPTSASSLRCLLLCLSLFACVPTITMLHDSATRSWSATLLPFLGFLLLLCLFPVGRSRYLLRTVSEVPLAKKRFWRPCRKKFGSTKGRCKSTFFSGWEGGGEGSDPNVAKNRF